MLIKEMSTASETRQRVHGMTYRYELEKYPFREELEKLFGLDLQDLHLWLGNFEKFDRKNDQQTIVHRVFYSNYSKIIEPILVFDGFVSGLARTRAASDGLPPVIPENI